MRQVCGVGITGFHEVAPVGFNDVGETQVDGAKLSADVAGFGVKAKDVRQLSGVNCALRLLAGDGAVEFIFEGWMEGIAMPQGLSADGAVE